jgi:hypothetical protein
MTAAFHLVKPTIAAVVLGLGCLAGHPLASADTFTNPATVSALALNQIGSGSLRPDVQYRAFDITVPPGTYDIRAWGDAPPDLDTVLYVAGPQSRGYGRAMATNDDEGGTKGSSALRLTLDGTYRIIVSTYRQVYSGTFHVLACPPGKCANALMPGPAAPDAPRAP